MGARYYAPWLARWTSADPIGLRGGTNVFAYCANNPVSRVDPSGTDWGWLNPTNWCNPFASDCEVVPIGIAKGFSKAAYHTVRDTGARVVDASTMTVAATGKATDWWDLGYTEWSPEAKAYDPDKSYSENANAALYNNTIGGAKQLATGIASGDPESIGAGVFAAAVAKAGGGANPKPPLSMPAVAKRRAPPKRPTPPSPPKTKRAKRRAPPKR
ncbi:MAG: RHS repeat-associated core domain-containing protein [Myxococcales bacterium]|nr:RHS repeat-associated core domain-containing protein [Myxococcales bacterium]